MISRDLSPHFCRVGSGASTSSAGPPIALRMNVHLHHGPRQSLLAVSLAATLVVLTLWVWAAELVLAAPGGAHDPWVRGERPHDHAYRATIRHDQGMGDWVQEFTISDSGRTIAYASRYTGGDIRMLRNDQDVGRSGFCWNRNVMDGLFRPGSEDLVWIEGYFDQPKYIVVNGERLGPFQQVRTLAWSPDGSRFAYVAERDSRSWAVIDGARSKEWDAIGGLAFSGDSKSVAYAAKEPRGNFLIVDGREIGPGPANLGVLWSPVGHSLAYIRRSGNGERWVVGEAVSDEHPVVGDLEFSATDPESYAFIASDDPEFPHGGYSKDGKTHSCRVVWKSAPQPVFDEVWDLQISRDGRTLVYKAKRAGEQLLVVNDRVIRHDDSLDPVTVFPEGTVLPRTISINGKWWIIAGRFRKHVKDLLPTRPSLVFLPDSSRVGFCVSDNKRICFREEETR